jgi:hypothetical protein
VETTDDLPKHLEFIQGVIERHARTSFLLKGWSVTLVAAVFLLAVRGAEPALAMMVGLLPATTFWGLDAFYLRQERLYVALYNAVRSTATPEPANRFSLNAKPYASSVSCWARTLFAPSLFWFHLSVVLVVIGALAFFHLKH